MGIHANHMDMTKFDHAQNAGYQAVSNELWRWAKAIRSRVLASSTEASGQTPAEKAGQKRLTELPESGYQMYQGGNQNSRSDYIWRWQSCAGEQY
jgi:hypothetical protein